MKTKITINNKEYEVELTDAQVKEIVGEEKGLWRPKMNERYWSVLGNGIVSSFFFYSDNDDTFALSIGNIFRTKEEAQQALKTSWVARLQAEQRIKEYIAKKGYDTEVDWGGSNKEKYYISYNYSFNKLITVTCWSGKVTNLPYFKHKHEAEDTMKAMEADYKILLGVE